MRPCAVRCGKSRGAGSNRRPGRLLCHSCVIRQTAAEWGPADLGVAVESLAPLAPLYPSGHLILTHGRLAGGLAAALSRRNLRPPALPLRPAHEPAT